MQGNWMPRAANRALFARLAALLWLGAQVAPAFAQPEAKTTTLQQIQKRGQVLCGATAPAPGFAQSDGAGLWTGLDADFCRALATAVFDDPAKIRVVPLAHKERLAALQSGEVDVLLSGAPWTQAREAGHQLLYGAITFYGGQGFLARKTQGAPTAAESEPQKLRDDGQATICVQQGSAAELNLADFYRDRKNSYAPRPYASLDDAARAFEKGGCNLVSADLVELHLLRAKLAHPGDYVVLPELISKAPVGPIVRQGDDQWFNIVRWTHFAMVDAEELGVDRDGVDKALESDNPDVRRLLGLDGDFGEGLGLPADWVYRVVKQVGNYGEIFERNLGQSSPLAMERRQNALWTKGGLMYAPPVR
jgi:general L-amino acid transport system substrate-binding protein